ncbi:MAG: DUF2177 family protein [Inquilinus sp.]|nr:DUF2177 family protein [Inquilinus sp.]
MTHAKAYAATLILFVAIDALWLGVVARDFYLSQLGAIMSAQPNAVVVGLFYLGYAAGIVFFAVAPALAKGLWTMAARNGAILGLMVYGTYELSNFAMLPGWPLPVTLIDLVYGTAATGIAAGGGFVIARKLT